MNQYHYTGPPELRASVSERHLASWPAVAAALSASGLPHPLSFTSAYIIRRCEACQSKNIVKDGVYECGVCGSPLPLEWNF